MTNICFSARSLMAIAAVGLLLFPPASQGHCDAADGPVVTSAKLAIEVGSVKPVLKWIKPQHEQEITTLFIMIKAARAQGGTAKELAESYFLETVVRLHRAGEGAPYTGIVAAGQIDPIIELTDQALESANPDKLVAALTAQVASGIRERFAQAVEARKHAEESVQKGREYVEAYVALTHYVESLHSSHKHVEPHAELPPEEEKAKQCPSAAHKK